MFKKVIDLHTGDWVYTPGGKVLEEMGVVEPMESQDVPISYLTEDGENLVLHIGTTTDKVEDGIIVSTKVDLATASLEKATGALVESDRNKILEMLKHPNSELTGNVMVFLANVAYCKNKYAFDIIRTKKAIFNGSYPSVPTSNTAYGSSYNARERVRSLYVMITSELDFFEQLLKTRYDVYKTDFEEMAVEDFLHKYKDSPMPNSVMNKIMDEDSLAGRVIRYYRKDVIRLCQLINEKEGGNNANLFIDWLKGFITLRGQEYDSGVAGLVKNFSELISSYGYNSHKLTDYLTRQSFYYGRFVMPVVEATNLRDYRAIAANINVVADEFPSYLAKAHNCMVRNSQGLRSVSDNVAKQFVKVCEESKKFYETKIGDYVVKLPEKHQDLFMEGIALNHCVGDYVQRVANHSTLVGFIRLKDKPEESLYTIEIDENHKVVQAKGAYNADVPEEIADLITKIEKRWEAKLMKGAAV